MTIENPRDCKHGRQRGKCADCDVEELEAKVKRLREELATEKAEHHRVLRWLQMHQAGDILARAEAAEEELAKLRQAAAELWNYAINVDGQ